MTIHALTGTWFAVCELCGARYKDWCGSSPCCGSTTVVVDNIATADEQAGADARLMENLFMRKKKKGRKGGY